MYNGEGRQITTAWRTMELLVLSDQLRHSFSKEQCKLPQNRICIYTDEPKAYQPEHSLLATDIANRVTSEYFQSGPWKAIIARKRRLFSIRSISSTSSHSPGQESIETILPAPQRRPRCYIGTTQDIRPPPPAC